MILPLLDASASAQIQYGIIWSVYVLLVDNVISFVFVMQVYKSRDLFYSMVAPNERIKAHNRMFTVMKAVTLLASISWICIIMAFVSGYVYGSMPAERQFLYRIGFSFSPLMYSGALVFVYTVRKLVPTSSDQSYTSFKEPESITLAPINLNRQLYRTSTFASSSQRSVGGRSLYSSSSFKTILQKYQE
ncbi:hypothetical protein HK103_003421 [Boothiomyces macroporosus]|uniref:Uncharacterized protein n=1 Tax=Boothiomyces macroporosus TaxID=261099 RepID=A0AAD5UKS6_9FUNG|nr:hypothetical protein HK103_003421 [Boothiomyces macroporosus]